MFEDVYRVTDQLRVITCKEVDEFEKHLGFPLPLGYREYLTTLGEGEYSSNLTVYTPSQVLANTEESRQRLIQYFDEFYTSYGPQPITLADIKECFPMANSPNGDDIIACRTRPGRLFILPHGEDQVVEAVEGFSNPKFVCMFDDEPFPFEWFEAHGPDRESAGIDFTTKMSGNEFASLFEKYWSHDEVRRIGDGKEKDCYIQLFLKAIGAHVIIQRYGGRYQIGFGMTYDGSKKAEYEKFASILKADPRLLEIKEARTVKSSESSNEPIVIEISAESITESPHQPVAILSGHEHDVQCLAFSTDGSRLVSGSSQTIKLWDVHSRQKLGEFTGHTGRINDVKFSPDGQILASEQGPPDWEIRLWDVATCKELHRFPGRINQSEVGGAFDALLGTLMAHAGNMMQGLTQARETLSAMLVGLTAGQKGGTGSLAFSPDGRKLYSIGPKEHIKIWDVATGKELGSYPGPADFSPMKICNTPQGELFAGGGLYEAFMFWQVDQPQIQFLFHTDRTVTRVSVSNGTAWFAALMGSEQASIWDTNEGKPRYRLSGRTDAFQAMVFSYDNRFFASGGDDKAVTLWDLPAHRAIANFGGFSNSVSTIAFSPDGHLLAAASGSEAKLWDMSDFRA